MNNLKHNKQKSELLKLRNVGAATCKDFSRLGIDSIAELAHASADDLYIQLQMLTGQSQDPCVWDVFAAAINEARTGERRPWWEWSKIRKDRQAKGEFI